MRILSSLTLQEVQSEANRSLDLEVIENPPDPVEDEGIAGPGGHGESSRSKDVVDVCPRFVVIDYCN
jgi:hypothetical protein